jgi:hypothetical protein
MSTQGTCASILWICATALAVTGCAGRQDLATAVYDPPPSGPYSLPLISPGTKFAALPPAVQHSIRAQTSGAQIEDSLL